MINYTSKAPGGDTAPWSASGRPAQDIDMMQQALKSIRRDSGLTADQLADKLGISERYIYKFELRPTSQWLLDIYGLMATRLIPGRENDGLF
jgi:hypothetical protein